MKVVLILLLFVGFISLLIFTLTRSRGAAQAPRFATVDQIRSIVSKLGQAGREGSFVVFMFRIPGNTDEVLPNLQYSIEDSQLGFDWVLLAPHNIKDESRLTDFLKRNEHTVSKKEMNGVSYLRVEGNNIEELGTKILRDFYQLPADTKLELIVEGFEITG
jgi:hypothetical protein